LAATAGTFKGREDCPQIEVQALYCGASKHALLLPFALYRKLGTQLNVWEAAHEISRVPQ
jgi:hypothetical protein